MSTRRDNPKGSLWRVAVERFNCVVIDDLKIVVLDHKADTHAYKLARARLWKEVADVYEIFLVGSCGRALSTDAPSADALKADEQREMTLLSVLGDVLKDQIDAPAEVNSLFSIISFVLVWPYLRKISYPEFGKQKFWGSYQTGS